MDISQFDLDVNEISGKIMKIADEMFPNRNWVMKATFWSDTDFRIEIDSSWGGKKDSFEYQKSTGQLKLKKITSVSESLMNVDSEEILEGVI